MFNCFIMRKIAVLTFIVLVLNGCKTNSSTEDSKDLNTTAVVQDSIPKRKTMIEKWSEYEMDTTVFAVKEVKNSKGFNIEELQHYLYWNVQMKYDRSEIIEKPYRYLNDINNFLNDYISYRFTLREQSIADANDTGYLNGKELQFARDTFMIDETCRLILHDVEMGYSAVRRKCFSYEFYSCEYLIYKYYMLALNNLEAEDKQILIQNQAEWETTLQSEYELEYLVERKYLGGAQYYLNRTSFKELRKRAEFLFWVYDNTSNFASFKF